MDIHGDTDVSGMMGVYHGRGGSLEALDELSAPTTAAMEPNSRDLQAGTTAAFPVAMARRLDDDKPLAAVLLARHVTLLDGRHIETGLAISEELNSLAGDHQELAAERHRWRMYDRPALERTRAMDAPLLTRDLEERYGALIETA
jgi:hypothetical protein